MKKLSKKKTNDTGLVIDVGGTFIRHALFNKATATIDQFQKIESPSFLRYPDYSIQELQIQLFNRIEQIVQYYEASSFSTVAIAFPAPMSSDGMVYQAAGLWGAETNPFPLLKRLKERMPSISFFLANDMTAAAERYASTGRYDSIDFFQIITISSSVGGKIYDVTQRKILLDRRGLGGEIGHIPVDFSSKAPLCDCGSKGHLAAVASGRAVERLMVQRSRQFPHQFKNSVLYAMVEGNENQIDTAIIIKALKEQDIFCQSILDESTFYVATAMAHSILNIGVEKFILTGGFALNLGQPYLDSVNRNLLKMQLYHRSPEEVLKMVDLGFKDECDGLIGIGLLLKRFL